MKPFAPSLHSPVPNDAAAWQPIVHDRAHQHMIAFVPVMRDRGDPPSVIERANEDEVLAGKGQGADLK